MPQLPRRPTCRRPANGNAIKLKGFRPFFEHDPEKRKPA
jgi:hypothetical protein